MITQPILYFDAGHATSRLDHLVELLKYPFLPFQPLQVVHLHTLLPTFEFFFLAHRIRLHLALLVRIGLKYGLLEKEVIVFLALAGIGGCC